MNRQRTKEWYIERLGYFTGSTMGILFTSSKSKNKGLFGDTAMSLIYEKAHERNLLDKVKSNDELWDIYEETVSVSSRAMKFGIEMEPVARNKYIKTKGLNMVETGFIKNSDIPFFGSSPDGFYYESDENGKGSLEIKVPKGSTFMKYRHEIKSDIDLLSVEKSYYIQCQCHILALNADWCDFVAFNPFVKDNIHIVRVLPNEEIIDEIKYRVTEANKIIESYGIR